MHIKILGIKKNEKEENNKKENNKKENNKKENEKKEDSEKLYMEKIIKEKNIREYLHIKLNTKNINNINDYIKKKKIEILQFIRKRLNLVISDKLDDELVIIKNDDSDLWDINSHNQEDIFFLIFYKNNSDNKSNNSIYVKICFNHLYCGIYIIHYINNIISEGEIVMNNNSAIIDQDISFKMKNLNFLKLILSKSYKINRNFNYNVENTNRINCKININQLNNLLEIDNFSPLKNISLKNKIFYFILKNIYKSLNIKKSFSIMSPVYFCKNINNNDFISKNNENNVGVIFLNFKDMNLEEFNDYYNKLEYHFIATNYYSNIGKSNNSDIRSNLDCIISFGFIKNNFYKGEAIFTHNKHSSTPIYCCSLVDDEMIHINFTNNTDDINTKKLLENLPNSKLLTDFY